MRSKLLSTSAALGVLLAVGFVRLNFSPHPCLSLDPQEETSKDTPPKSPSVRKRPRMSNADKLKQMIESLRARESQIEFFARIVDDQGRPIEGARAVLSIRHFNLAGPLLMGTPPVEAESDKQGRIHLKGEVGWLLSVETIEKPGYKFEPKGDTVRRFKFERGGEVFRSDPDNYPVFQMRKNEGTRSFDSEPPKRREKLDLSTTKVVRFFEYAYPEQMLRLNLRTGAIVKEERNRSSSDASEASIRFESLPPKEGQAFHLRISVPGEGGGVQFLNKPLTVAPKDGYQPSLSLSVDLNDVSKNGPPKRDIVFRRGDGSMHAMIEFGAIYPQHGDETTPLERWIAVGGRAFEIPSEK